MTPGPLETPIVLFIFNRADTTARVFQRIREVRPKRLFIVADAPRPRRDDDRARCDAARRATDPVDWDCDVARLYADGHRGLKRSIESGLTSVFDRVGEAIILEDDCLPSATFFQFCEELLDRYRGEDRVMTVSGSRFHPPLGNSRGSYHFSRYPLIWGWATWRRAWSHYDGSMAGWPRVRDSGALEELAGGPQAARYWAYVLDRNRQLADEGTWDYAWLLSSWLQGGLTAASAVNLVTNIGFSSEGTHNKDARMLGANLAAADAIFPLHHPDRIERDQAEDQALDSHLFSGTLNRLVSDLRARIAAGRPMASR